MGNNIQVKPLQASAAKEYSDPTERPVMMEEDENGEEAANGLDHDADGNNSMEESAPQESDEDNFVEEEERVEPPKPKKQKKSQETNGSAKTPTKKAALKQ